MNTVRASLSFRRLSDGDLAIFADSVITKMTGNTAFPTLAPTLASVQTLLTTYTDALAAAKGGGVALTAAKNAARTELVTALRSLAFDVQDTCGNDPAVFLTSGFELVKASTPAGSAGPGAWSEPVKAMVL